MSSITNPNPFSALLAAELAAAAAPLQKALAEIAAGDGSIPSVTGAFVALQGEFIASLPTLQKIGLNTLAGDLNQYLTNLIAQQAAAASTTPAPSPAPAVALVEKSDEA